jgi:hypothetical protein
LKEHVVIDEYLGLAGKEISKEAFRRLGSADNIVFIKLAANVESWCCSYVDVV